MSRGSFAGWLEGRANSALTRGPGYEPTPLGRAFDDSSIRGYYLDYSSKTAARGGRERDPAVPTPAIQLALGWWERHLAGEAGAREAFLEATDAVVWRAERVGDELHWPIHVPIAKHRLVPPWRSSLPQAQAASVLVRAHLATSEDRYAELAIAAVAPLLAESGSDIVTHTGSGPILQEAPSDPPSHILNGWISSLWGLWDVGRGLDHARANAVFEASLACLRACLHAYDCGWWTRYSLYPHALEDLAKPIYHRAHIDQVDALHRLTGHDDLKDARDRWIGYDRTANRALAVAQKAVYTAVEAPRRRRWERGA